MMCVFVRACVCVSLRMKWVYHDSRYYHDDIGVDVVRARLIRVPVIQHHTSVVDCEQREKTVSRLFAPPQQKPELLEWEGVKLKESSGFLTRQNVLVSVLVLVLCSLTLFATVEQFALLLLQRLDTKREESQKSTDSASKKFTKLMNRDEGCRRQKKLQICV